VTLDADNGTLAIGSGGDISSGGVVQLTASGGIRTAGDVTTTGAAVNFNSQTTLTGAVVINTTSGSATGAAVDFDSTVDGGFGLTLTAGTAGDVTFGLAVGGSTPLGAISIASANDVTFSSTVRAASLSQAAGSVTTLADNVTTTTGTGVSITATDIRLDGLTIDTTSGNGAVSLTGAVRLDGATTITRGTGAVAFSSTVDSQSGEANALTLNGASGGDVTFTGAVGSSANGELGAILVSTGQTVTFSSTLEAASLVQTAGTLTVLADNVTTTGTGVSITATDIQLDGLTIDTSSGNGVVSLTGAVRLDGPATITRGTGAVTFASTVDSQASEANALTLNGASGGNVTFTGAVGAATNGALGAILVSTAQSVTFSSTVTAASLAQSTGSGTTAQRRGGHERRRGRVADGHELRGEQHRDDDGQRPGDGERQRDARDRLVRRHHLRRRGEPDGDRRDHDGR
jgi:hypothetical protein